MYQILQWIGLIQKIHTDANENVLESKSCIPLFHPYRHVPPNNPKMTTKFPQSKDTLCHYSNQCKMFNYSHAQAVVSNKYASILKKLMNKIMLLFLLMNQESWPQNQHHFTILKLRLQKRAKIKIEINIKQGSRKMYK